MLYHSLFSLLSPYNTAHAGLLQCDRMEHTRKPLLPHQGVPMRAVYYEAFGQMP